MYKVIIVDNRPVTVEQMTKLKAEFPNAEITVLVPDAGKDSREAVNSFTVKKAMEYIEEYYRETLTLAEVAEHVYVSKWYLSKLLNQHMGNGFSQILNIIRISHAKELLRDQSLRISDIAEMVGFVHVSHFSRVFKKITGISANKYRNKMQ